MQQFNYFLCVGIRHEIISVSSNLTIEETFPGAEVRFEGIVVSDGTELHDESDDRDEATASKRVQRVVFELLQGALRGVVLNRA